MALDITEVDGFYVSSSLPKALIVPALYSYPQSKRDNSRSSDVLYFKPKTRSTKQKPTSRPYSNDLPVEGRQHLAVQTDLYLEELCDVVEEADVQCQTDPYLDRPPSPLFVPAKSGVDAETQIYPGDLFDLEPILDSLVEQTLKQALDEIIAEDELASSADLKTDYETRKSSEVVVEPSDFDEDVEPIIDSLVEQTLEQTVKEIIAEDELVSSADLKMDSESKNNAEEVAEETSINEQEEPILLDDEVAQKIVACIFSQNYLSELVPQVYKKLEVEGCFDADDPEIQELEESFWPWLMNEVDNEIATLDISCQLLDTLIEDTVQNITESSLIHKPSDLEKEEENTSDKIDSKASNDDHEVKITESD